jgi:four helix bundle protein
LSAADRLAARAKAFAARVLTFVNGLPHDYRSDGVLKQLINSSGSVSANYHASRRSRSRREYVAKLGVVAEEADETEHWLQVLTIAGAITTAAPQEELAFLLDEATQLRAIFVASFRTARANYERENPRRKKKDTQG